MRLDEGVLLASGAPGGKDRVHLFKQIFSLFSFVSSISTNRLLLLLPYLLFLNLAIVTAEGLFIVLYLFLRRTQSIFLLCRADLCS